MLHLITLTGFAGYFSENQIFVYRLPGITWSTLNEEISEGREISLLVGLVSFVWLPESKKVFSLFIS